MKTLFGSFSLLLICMSFVFAATTSWQLSPQGLGPIKVGMTLSELQNTAHSKLTKSKPDMNMGEDVSCFTTEFRDKKYDGVSFMISNGKVVRINIASGKFATNKGIRINDDEKKVINSYPNLHQEPHKYESSGHYLTVYEPPANAIRFETNGKKVTLMYAGQKKEVGYVEDCL